MQRKIHRYNIEIYMYVCHIIIKWNAIYIATMAECIMTAVTFNMFITVVYFFRQKKYKTTTTTIEKLQQRI